MKRTALPLVLILTTLSACKMEPPISVGHRESMVGQGIVLDVTNTSDDYLHEVTVTIESPAGEVKSYSIPTLRPHETENVGWLKLDGWPIPEGSEVTVSCKGYRSSFGPWKVSS